MFFDKQLSRSLFFNFVHKLCSLRSDKNNLYLASLPRISANLNENYRCYNFPALTNISWKFW